jgi:hypothetical protein
VKRWLPFLWLLLPLSGLAEVGFHSFIESRIPTEEDWERAAGLVGEGWQEGDLVVIAPLWASQGWKHLGRFMTVEQMAREDDRGYGRIWEVALPGHRHEEYGRTGELTSEARAGRLTVRTYQFPGAPTTVYDFVSALEKDGSVSMVSGAGAHAEPCTFRQHPRAGLVPNAAVQTGKFHCDPRLPWNTVDREVIADLENRPRLCIWAHPVQGKRVRIAFKGVPEASVIEGHVAKKYEADRETIERPPVILEISAGGKIVGSALHEHGSGWTPYRFEIGPGGTGGEVAFEIFAQSVGMAHFCFTAKLRDK